MDVSNTTTTSPTSNNTPLAPTPLPTAPTSPLTDIAQLAADERDSDADSDATNSPVVSPTNNSNNNNASQSTPNDKVYTAIYSNIPVYEMMFKGIQVMKRISDSWLNATHILKAAGYSKPKRTKILEQEVLQLHHEKIQGGYGKYQGTWINKENGIKLAKKHKVDVILKDLLEFEASNGDVALTKLNFNAHHGILPPPKVVREPKEKKVVGGIGGSGVVDVDEPRILRTSADQQISQPGSPIPSQPRVPRVAAPTPSTSTTAANVSSSLAQPSNTYNEGNQEIEPPRVVIPVKRPVGRPPRIPRPPGYTAPQTPAQSKLVLPSTLSAAAKAAVVVKRPRRVSYAEIDMPLSPPGVEMRANMELGNAVYLFTPENDDSTAFETCSKPTTLTYDPEYYASEVSKPPTTRYPTSQHLQTPPRQEPPETPPSSTTTTKFPSPALQRQLILLISTSSNSTSSTPEVISLLRDPTYHYSPLDPLNDPTPPPPIIPYVNPNLILDAKQHTPLHWAAAYARVDLVETLLAYAGNPRAINVDLETPLMRAVATENGFREQNFSDLLALLGPESARMCDNKGRNVLHKLAIRGGNLRAGGGWEAKGDVAQSYYMKCVVEWIDEGGFLSWLGGTKESLSQLGADVYKSKVKSVVAAFVNETDENGDTPLHLAVRGRCLGVVELLVKLGASLELTNENGDRPGDCCDLEDSVMVDALKYETVGRRGRVRGSSQEADVENQPMDLFEKHIRATRSEVEALHQSQNRLKRLRQRALDLGKKLRRPNGTNSDLLQATTPIVAKPLIILDQHQQVANRFSTSPPTSVTLSSYDSTGSSPRKLPAIELLPQSSMSDSSPNVSDVEEGSPHIKQSQITVGSQQQQETSPPQALRDLGYPLTYSPIVSSVTSVEFSTETIPPPGNNSLLSTPPQALAPLPTPPTTTRPPNPLLVFPLSSQQTPSLHVLRRLQDQVEANERSQKRLFEEIDTVWTRRGDKTKRYKKMLVDVVSSGGGGRRGTDVTAKRVEDELLAFDGERL